MRSTSQLNTREIHVHDRRHGVDLDNPHVEGTGKKRRGSQKQALGLRRAQGQAQLWQSLVFDASVLVSAKLEGIFELFPQVGV